MNYSFHTAGKLLVQGWLLFPRRLAQSLQISGLALLPYHRLIPIKISVTLYREYCCETSMKYSKLKARSTPWWDFSSKTFANCCWWKNSHYKKPDLLSLYLPQLHLWSWYFRPWSLGMMSTKWSQPHPVCLIHCSSAGEHELHQDSKITRNLHHFSFGFPEELALIFDKISVAASCMKQKHQDQF